MGETQVAQIQFAGSEDKSSSQLGGAMPTVVNAVIDRTGTVRRRPGIKLWSDWPSTNLGAYTPSSPVIGMCPFGQKLVFVTEDRMIHAVSPGGTVEELSSATATTQLDGSGRPVFVEGRDMLVIAGGGAMQKWTGTGLTARLRNIGAYNALPGTDPGGDPPQTPFICGIARRLVAMVEGPSGQIWWSGPNSQYEDWDMATGGASFLQAEAKPDPLVAMHDNTNEVFAWGTKTLQVYVPAALAVDENDPNNLLDFTTSRTMNLGTISPYSIEPIDDMFGLIDRLKRAIITDGRSYQDISPPVASLLRDMKNVENCWAFRLKFGRFDAIVWMFPSDGYGLLYDQQLKVWSEWRAWDDKGPTDVTITSAYNWSERSVFLVGMSDGTIAQLDDETNTDLGDPIKLEIVSGFSNHGTMAQKHCRTLMLTFKRTWAPLANRAPSQLSPSGFVSVYSRDEEGSWEHIRDLELSNDQAPCEQIRSLGVYRTRQWKVEYTGEDEIQLVGAQEEYEILGA